MSLIHKRTSTPEDNEMQRCYIYGYKEESTSQARCKVRTTMRCADCGRPCCFEHRVRYGDETGPVVCIHCMTKRRKASRGHQVAQQYAQLATLPPMEELQPKPVKKLARKPEKAAKPAPAPRKKRRHKRPVSPEQRLLDKDLQKVASGRVPATVRSKASSRRRQRLLEQHPFKVGNCSRCYARRVLYQKRVLFRKVWRCEDCW